MLTERVMGVLSYCFVVFIGYMFIKRKRVALGLSICLVLLVVLAFFYIPSEDADLYRIRNMTANWGDYSLEDILRDKILKSSVPVAHFIYFIVAKIGVAGVLPAFAAFVFFGNAFHIFKHIAREKRYSSDAIAVTFLLFMSSGAFLEVISGIRCFMAISIIARFAYDEVTSKNLSLLYLPFYLIASLMHSAALMLTIIWLTFTVFRSRKLSIIKLFINLITVLSVVTVSIILGFDYISSMIDKAELFLNNEVYSYIWEYIIGALQLIIYILILIKSRKKMHSDFIGFSILMVIIVLCFCFEYNIFHRFIAAVSFFMIPVSVHTDDGQSGIKLKDIFLWALIILFIACTRGNLCGFKFILLR